MNINDIDNSTIPQPFAKMAESSYKRNIETGNSTTPPTNNQATWNWGFPPITFLPINDGSAGTEENTGIPPSGSDFNGLGYALSNPIYNMQCGIFPNIYSQSISNLIGGYPNGAIVFWVNGTDTRIIQSTGDSNTLPPYVNGVIQANWKLLYAVPKRYVVDAGVNNNGNYELWSDGYKVQWGRGYISNGYGQITLPIAFSDNNYYTNVNQYLNSQTASYKTADAVQVRGQTTTSINFVGSDNYDGAISTYITWCARGY